MKPYKFLPDIATADIAFEANGKSLEELFRNCALATFEVMADVKRIEPKITKKISLKGKSEENLLYDFLSELIFLKDSESLLFNKFDISIDKDLNLEATAYGETINHEKHHTRLDVKAVTLHMFKVEKTKAGWKATVILDI